jgi:LuxR family maltose regulon positive regulatory protein
VQALVAAALARTDGQSEEAMTRFDAAAGLAELAGPWATDWIRDEAAGPRDPGTPFDGPWVIGWDGRVVEPLTRRELEVLAAMSEWLTTEEIADKLFVSVNTVRTHVRNILTKLGVSRRNAAIREAFRLGLLTSGAQGVLASSHVRPG